MRELPSYHGCFVCGKENPAGLQAVFTFDDHEAVTEFTPPVRFEGYRGMLHGGILASLLDEVMIKAVMAGGLWAVTAEMTVKFLLPVPTGRRLILKGRVTSHKNRLFATEGEAVSEDGTVYATSSGKYLVPRTELAEKLKQSAD